MVDLGILIYDEENIDYALNVESGGTVSNSIPIALND